MMKKCAFLAVFCLLVASASYAQVTSLTLDWAKTMTMEGTVSYVTYNFATDHFLVCQYNAAAGKRVAIVNSDATAILGYLDETGLDLGTLNVFSICVADDGVIYGGTNNVVDTAEARSIIRWANESAAPTQQNQVGMHFPRTMDAVGSGVNTRIAVAGDNDGQVSVLTTTDGVNFSYVRTNNAIVTGVYDNLIKQDVALVSDDPDTIYGTKNDGAGQVVCLVNDSGNWIAKAGFTPPNSYTTLAAANDIDICEGHNALFIISGRSADSNDQIMVLDADTGAQDETLTTKIGFDRNAAGYGTTVLDESAGEGFFGGRTNMATIAVFGKYSFNAVVPTPTNTPIPPTPTKSSGVQGFEVYE